MTGLRLQRQSADYLPALLQSEALQLLNTAEKHTWQGEHNPREPLTSSEQNKHKIPNFIRMQNY